LEIDMKTITIAEDFLEGLDFVQGKNTQEKIFHLIVNNVLLRLRECDESLFQFESRYGMDFESLARAWDEDEIPESHSHEVERDYMEWEGFHGERRKLLRTLKTMRMKERR
jgi:hypothetical protein